MRRLRTALLAGLMALALAAPVLGAKPAVQGQHPVPQNIDNGNRIDVNNLDMVVTNHGSLAYDLQTGNAGLIFPRGSTKTAVFASGPWIGAMVNGDVRVTVGEYSQEYNPGVMLTDSTWADPADPRFKVYKMTADPSTWPNYTQIYPDAASRKFAYGPPVDSSAAGFNPSDPSTWKPKLFGDQTLWSVYNDADRSVHTNRAGNSLPLGVQVEQMVFGFNRQAPLGNMVFVKFRITNKGKNTLDSTYVSCWVDPDLGGATDDLVGCDTLLSLGYDYNSTNNDEMYGSAPPAVGYDFFQ